jgi:hypothetical protein
MDVVVVLLVMRRTSLVTHDAGTFTTPRDAARTVAAFSAHLRDQVDLGTLSTELLAVVDQTVQPTQASLWLRPTPPHGRRPGRG